jgi:bifunctional non-homologous end joining protein LigD
MPRKILPMLATLAEAPFDRDGWIFEIKWDGYRILADVRPGAVTLISRNGHDYTQRYGPAARALRKLKHRAVLDGEMVVLDASGASSFQDLADYARAGSGRLAYAVFDLLSLDGVSREKMPLIERKRLLKKILPKDPALLYSDHVETRGKAFFGAAKRKGLEGIMAKDASSPYLEGVRSEAWQKIKARRRQEVVIAGFTEPRRARKYFGALVVGVQEGGKLTYVGHTGGGFDVAGLRRLSAKLKPLIRKTSPFSETVRTNAPVHWVKPVLVCEVEFAGWTAEGHMRQPIFVGLREDKPAKDVVRERPHRAGSRGVRNGRPRRHRE